MKLNKYPLSDDGLTIFLFHGVVNELNYQIRNYNRKHIEGSYFAALIEDWKKEGVPLSMDEVVELKTSGKDYPKKSFAITFDDGFANNLLVAAPILASFDVPAIFYCTTGFIESNSMSWIDRIEYLFEESELPKLRLPWSGVEYSLDTRDSKISALQDIRAHVKNNSQVDPEAVVSSVFSAVDKPIVFASEDPLDKKLSWEQVRALDGHPLFQVAGHSHTHAVLSFLDDSRLKQEIATSIELLRSKAGIESIHYAYPEGLAHCFDARVIQELKSCGVRCSPSAIPGINTCKTDLFELRRIMVT